MASISAASGSATAQTRGHGSLQELSYYDATDVARDNHGRILSQCQGNARPHGAACPADARYQLPHRTSSVWFDANQFAASTAFNAGRAIAPKRWWVYDFQSFLDLFWRPA
jgi:hypothetical protein